MQKLVHDLSMYLILTEKTCQTENMTVSTFTHEKLIVFMGRKVKPGNINLIVFMRIKVKPGNINL